MPFVDDELFYSVDFKMNSIEMTEKGRDFITGKNEDPNFFVIPDVGEDTAIIEQKMKEKKKSILDITADTDYTL